MRIFPSIFQFFGRSFYDWTTILMIKKENNVSRFLKNNLSINFYGSQTCNCLDKSYFNIAIKIYAKDTRDKVNETIYDEGAIN